MMEDKLAIEQKDIERKDKEKKERKKDLKNLERELETNDALLNQYKKFPDFL
jgi:hypothetical protein